MKRTESSCRFLSGRKFTAQEIQDIQETIESCGLSWHELLHTICEHLKWVTPAGQNKVGSCAKALTMLEAEGLVRLPAKQACKGSKQTIALGEGTEPEEEVRGTVRDHAPVQLQPVGSKELMRLWNEYVERYHPLGYKRPFGAHQRYFIEGKGGRRWGVCCSVHRRGRWRSGMNGSVGACGGGRSG